MAGKKGGSKKSRRAQNKRAMLDAETQRRQQRKEQEVKATADDQVDQLTAAVGELSTTPEITITESSATVSQERQLERFDATEVKMPGWVYGEYVANIGELREAILSGEEVNGYPADKWIEYLQPDDALRLLIELASHQEGATFIDKITSMLAPTLLRNGDRKIEDERFVEADRLADRSIFNMLFNHSPKRSLELATDGKALSLITTVSAQDCCRFDFANFHAKHQHGLLHVALDANDLKATTTLIQLRHPLGLLNTESKTVVQVAIEHPQQEACQHLLTYVINAQPKHLVAKFVDTGMLGRFTSVDHDLASKFATAVWARTGHIEQTDLKQMLTDMSKAEEVEKGREQSGSAMERA